jgi:hypothetical protein
MRKERVAVEEFRAVVDTHTGERAIASHLKRHPWMVFWTFCATSGHDRYLLTEFPLGSRYKVDFVALRSYSGAWDGHLIELEPLADKPFTRAGSPSRRLAGALRQIDDWRTHIELDGASLPRDLVRWAKRRDILKYPHMPEPSNYTGDLLADSETVVLWHYHVVIGRSSRLERAERYLAGRYVSHHGVEVVSYDRLLSLAERRYGVKQSSDPESAA